MYFSWSANATGTISINCKPQSTPNPKRRGAGTTYRVGRNYRHRHTGTPAHRFGKCIILRCHRSALRCRLKEKPFLSKTMNSPRLTFTVAPIVCKHMAELNHFSQQHCHSFGDLHLENSWVAKNKLPVFNHWPPSMFFCCSVLRRYPNRCCQRNLILPKSRHAILWRLAGIGPRVCIYSDWVRIPSKHQVRRESTQTCLFCKSQTSLSQFRRDGQWRKHCISSSWTGKWIEDKRSGSAFDVRTKLRTLSHHTVKSSNAQPLWSTANVSGRILWQICSNTRASQKCLHSHTRLASIMHLRYRLVGLTAMSPPKRLQQKERRRGGEENTTTPRGLRAGGGQWVTQRKE